MVFFVHIMLQQVVHHGAAWCLRTLKKLDENFYETR